MINPTRFDLGRKVIYTRNPLSSENPARGTIVSFDKSFVFVRVIGPEGREYVKAARPADLEWVQR